MKKIMTGIRPTGPLHLGHYKGALEQWVKLQDDYECYFMLADIQALTTHSDSPELIEESVKEVVKDMLSVGLDPSKDNVNFILQSAIPELSELTVYLSMITPFSWMESNPTIMTEMKNIKKISTGFMYYPVSQAADILFVSSDPKDSEEPILVPVGEDQQPHIRDTNNIVKAFNRTYGPTFVKSKALVGDFSRMVGTDGDSKMSKSQENAIYLKDKDEELKKKVMSMFTDPNRIHPTDPGTVEGNPVFIYHDAFNSNKDQLKDFKDRYKKGKVGDVEIKQALFEVLQEFLSPIQEKRDSYSDEDIMEILEEGTKKARKEAKTTLNRVKKNMHLDYLSF